MMQKGFTLLELLVVLSIVAMAAGLMVPSASRWMSAARERAWQQELRAELAALPMRAFRRGEPLELDALAFRALANKAASWPIPNQPGGHLEFFLENLLQKPVIAQEGSRE